MSNHSNATLFAGYKDAYLGDQGGVGRTHSSDVRREQALKDPHTQAMLQQHTAAFDLWLGLSLTPNVGVADRTYHRGEADKGETFADRIATATTQEAPRNDSSKEGRQSSLPRYIEPDFYHTSDKEHKTDWYNQGPSSTQDLLTNSNNRRNSFGLGANQVSAVEPSPTPVAAKARKAVRGFGPAPPPQSSGTSNSNQANLSQIAPTSNKIEVVKQRLRGVGHASVGSTSNGSSAGPAGFRAMWRAAVEGANKPPQSQQGQPNDYYERFPPSGPMTGISQSVAHEPPIATDLQQYHGGSIYEYYAATHRVATEGKRIHATGSMTVSESSEEGMRVDHRNVEGFQLGQQGHNYTHSQSINPDSLQSYPLEGHHQVRAPADSMAPLRPPYGTSGPYTEHSDAYHSPNHDQAREQAGFSQKGQAGSVPNRFLSGASRVSHMDEESRVGALLTSPPNSQIRDTLAARSGVTSSSPWGRQLAAQPKEEGPEGANNYNQRVQTPAVQNTNEHTPFASVRASPAQQSQPHGPFDSGMRTTTSTIQASNVPSPSRHSVVAESFRATPIVGHTTQVNPSADYMQSNQQSSYTMEHVNERIEGLDGPTRSGWQLNNQNAGQSLHEAQMSSYPQGPFLTPPTPYTANQQQHFYPSEVEYHLQHPPHIEATTLGSHQYYAAAHEPTLPQYQHYYDAPGPSSYSGPAQDPLYGGAPYQEYPHPPPNAAPYTQHEEVYPQHDDRYPIEIEHHPSYYGITGGAEQQMAEERYPVQSAAQYLPPTMGEYIPEEFAPEMPHVVATYSSPKRISAYGEPPVTNTSMKTPSAQVLPTASSNSVSRRPPLPPLAPTSVGSPLPIPYSNSNGSPTPTADQFAAQVDAVMTRMANAGTSVAEVLSQRAQQHKTPAPAQQSSRKVSNDEVTANVGTVGKQMDATRSYLPTPNANDLRQLLTAPAASYVQDGGTQTTPLPQALEAPAVVIQAKTPTPTLPQQNTVSTQVTPQPSSLRDVARPGRSGSIKPSPSSVSNGGAESSLLRANASKLNQLRPPAVLVDGSHNARTPSTATPISTAEAYDHTTQTDPQMGRHLVSTGVGARTPSLVQPTYSSKSITTGPHQMLVDNRQTTITSHPATALAEPLRNAPTFSPSLPGAIGVVTPQPSTLSQKAATPAARNNQSATTTVDNVPQRSSAIISTSSLSKQVANNSATAISSTAAPSDALALTNSQTIVGLQKKLATLVKAQEGLYQSNEAARMEYEAAAKVKAAAEADAAKDEEAFRSQAIQLEQLLAKKAEVLQNLKEENRILREKARAARGLGGE